VWFVDADGAFLKVVLDFDLVEKEMLMQNDEWLRGTRGE
jgi:hypothetical protein